MNQYEGKSATRGPTNATVEPRRSESLSQVCDRFDKLLTVANGAAERAERVADSIGGASPNGPSGDAADGGSGYVGVLNYKLSVMEQHVARIHSALDRAEGAIQ